MLEPKIEGVQVPLRGPIAERNAPAQDSSTAEPFGEPDDPLELPFDQYQRYRLVADIVTRLLPAGRRSAILDVGGRTALLRKFLPGHPITLVDFEASEECGLVLGDGSRLPFQDRSFDAVTACDTLEHVPVERRADFVRECARVSRGAVVIAGPYRAQRVDEAEGLLVDLVRGKLGFRHRYLEEHRLLGLPVLAEVERGLAAAGAQVASVGHANLERWLTLMGLELYMDEEPQLRKVARRYFRFYNQALYAADFAGPHYRHAAVGWLGSGQLEPLLRGISTQGGDARAVRPFGELLNELIAFDRERDVYEAERARLIAVNDGLVRDLEGHRAVLAEQRAELEAQAAVIQELRREYDALRPHASQLESELQSANGRLIAQNEALIAKDREIAALRAQLRDRLENLRRALSLKKPAF